MPVGNFTKSEVTVVKKLILSFMCMLLLMSSLLTACGSDDEDDPNLGVYEAKTAEMSGFEIDIDDVYENGFTIELKGKGKGVATIDNEEEKIKWTLDGKDFHAEGGGVELDGTLKDGVMVLEDLLGTGMNMTLECDEVMKAASDSKKPSKKDKTDKSKEDDSKDDQGENDTSARPGSKRPGKDFADKEQVGKWVLTTVTQDGQVYMQNDLRKKGIDSWIQMDADGTGQIYLAGDLTDMEWDDSQIVELADSDGERNEYRYSLMDNFLVLVDGDMTLAFEREEGSAGNSSGARPVIEAAEIPEGLMARYEGDWHGLVLFFNAQGDTFASRDNTKTDVAARIALDEDGNVTPYFAEAKDDDSKYNFADVEAELDPDMECMFVSGKLLDGEFELAAVSEENGLLHMYFTIYAGNGDSIDAELAMRHPDDPWQDGDYPMYPKEGFEYYKGCTLEQVLKDFGKMPAGLPEKTNITGWE